MRLGGSAHSACRRPSPPPAQPTGGQTRSPGSLGAGRERAAVVPGGEVGRSGHTACSVIGPLDHTVRRCPSHEMSGKPIGPEADAHGPGRLWLFLGCPGLTGQQPPRCPPHSLRAPGSAPGSHPGLSLWGAVESKPGTGTPQRLGASNHQSAFLHLVQIHVGSDPVDGPSNPSSLRRLEKGTVGLGAELTLLPHGGRSAHGRWPPPTWSPWPRAAGTGPWGLALTARATCLGLSLASWIPPVGRPALSLP